MRLDVFYPTHHLIAIFRSPAGGESASRKFLNAGFAPSDAMTANGGGYWFTGGRLLYSWLDAAREGTRSL
jgi:hypothetical protein